MKTAFITGGNRGIGLETARQLGKLGYHVIIGSRDGAKGKEAVATLVSQGIKADYTVVDTANEESVKQAAADVASKCNGVLDVLINNAGYSSAPGDAEKVNLDDLRRCFEINVVGTVCVTNHFLDMVKKAPAGRIVNVGSIMGSLAVACAGLPTCPYNTSKTALNMYTVNLAAALKDTNVKVNSGHPGWVKTDMGGPNADLSVEEGAETNVYLATLPADGPTGGYFFRKERLPW